MINVTARSLKRQKHVSGADTHTTYAYRLVPPKRISDITYDQMVRKHMKQLSYNSRCPCDSGKRFKRCCMKGE